MFPSVGSSFTQETHLDMEPSPQENIVPLRCEATVPQAALPVVKLVHWLCLCLEPIAGTLAEKKRRWRKMYMCFRNGPGGSLKCCLAVRAAVSDSAA